MDVNNIPVGWFYGDYEVGPQFTAASRPLDTKPKRKISKELVEYLHQNGFAHGDLYARNLRAPKSEDDKVLFVDFD